MGWFGRSGDGEGGPTVRVPKERSQAVVGWLVPLDGRLMGQDFRLVTGDNTVGSGADCDVVLPDGYLSARHAVVRHVRDGEGRFELVDLASTNGSWVNGVAVDDVAPLRDGDVVRLGRLELKFRAF